MKVSIDDNELTENIGYTIDNKILTLTNEIDKSSSIEITTEYNHMLNRKQRRDKEFRRNLITT